MRRDRRREVDNRDDAGRASCAAGPPMRVVKKILVYAWAPFANLGWYLHTVVMATISLLLWPFDRSGELQHWCARWWCRLIAWTIFARIRVYGAENLEPKRTYVYMANHSSLI